MFKDVVEFIRDLYGGYPSIPLHAPVFKGNELKYLNETIESTFVSSVGAFVDQFEKEFARYTGANYAVVTSNGTLALHAALVLVGVKATDEVITQALTFVATANAITYCGAKPVFVDCDESTLGMLPDSLQEFLQKNAEVKDGICFNRKTGNRIAACVPMHTFGHPVKIQQIVKICDEYCIPVIEDAAESLGSYSANKHTGLFGKIGVFSFNGNKIITSGGGGMLVMNDPALAKRAKHITTTAKLAHAWNFVHDEVGYNYRMPNLNAALGLAQLEQLPMFLENKRQTAEIYKDYFSKKGFNFFSEPSGAKSNYWLNAILLKDRKERDLFLEESNSSGVMARPVWTLMNELPMYKDCLSADLKISKNLADRIVNIPSSVRSV